MTAPVPRNRQAYSFINGVFGNEDFAYIGRIEQIEGLKRTLQQIEATATGHHERYVALIGKLHACLYEVM